MHSIEPATEAIRSCEARGYAVSAFVVDPSGVVKLQARGDYSTIHTQDAQKGSVEPRLSAAGWRGARKRVVETDN